jgi:hypothetical protein
MKNLIKKVNIFIVVILGTLSFANFALAIPLTPEISLSSSSYDMYVGGSYIEPTVTAPDDINGTVTVTQTGTVDTHAVGTYVITYTATDPLDLTATADFTVNVLDNISPVITINGETPTTIPVGSIYTDLGATAIDNADGDMTADIVVTGTVNTNLVGIYMITYTVTDEALNVATSTRTVNVVSPSHRRLSVATNESLENISTTTVATTTATTTMVTTTATTTISTEIATTTILESTTTEISSTTEIEIHEIIVKKSPVSKVTISQKKPTTNNSLVATVFEASSNNIDSTDNINNTGKSINGFIKNVSSFITNLINYIRFNIF